MVQIIENPAYTGGPVNPTGENLAGALNGIAGAFLNSGRGDLVRAKFAAEQQQEMQKQAAIGTIADVFGRHLGQNADYAQDYAQDAPDYSAPQPYQPPPFQFNPSQFSQAALQSGVDLGQIGKTLQLSAAIQGGPNAPGVVTGAIPANTVSGTPQYIDQAAAAEANKGVTVSQGADLVNPATKELIYTNPKEAGPIVPHDIGRDEFGQPIQGTIDASGVGHPIKIEGQNTGMPKEAAAVGETIPDDKSPDLALPPDQQAKLERLPLASQGRVKAILQGRETLPQMTGRQSPATAKLIAAVFDVNPSFDAVANRTLFGTRKNYAPGGSNNTPGTLIINGDTALDHLAELKIASDKLANLGSVLGGATNMAANVTGGRVGHDYSVAKSELDTAAQVAAGETIKYLAGVGGGGQEERTRLEAQFGSGTPPDSRVGAMHKLAKDILDKKQQLQAGWHRSMGVNAPDFEVISPDSVKSLAKLGMGNWATNGRPLAQNGPVVQSAPQNTTGSQNVVTNAPQGDPLAGARAAIAKGASRDAVIQRLQQNGIDPAGL